MLCEKCGTKFKYKGVVCPVRLLCDCESYRCSKCKAVAVCVEFSVPVKIKEPPLDDKKSSTLFCDGHAPAGTDSLYEKAEKKASLFSSVNIEELVECVKCKDVHKMGKRKNFNGTYSECPKCKEDVHVHAWIEEKKDGRNNKEISRKLH